MDAIPTICNQSFTRGTEYFKEGGALRGRGQKGGAASIPTPARRLRPSGNGYLTLPRVHERLQSVGSNRSPDLTLVVGSTGLSPERRTLALTGWCPENSCGCSALF